MRRRIGYVKKGRDHLRPGELASVGAGFGENRRHLGKQTSGSEKCKAGAEGPWKTLQCREVGCSVSRIITAEDRDGQWAG